MKVLRLFLSLCLFCLLAISSVAIAQPDRAQLTRSAQFAPVDTMIYASIRTDRAYIETLDRLLTPLIVAVSTDALPPDVTSLLDYVNQLLEEASGFPNSRVAPGSTVDSFVFDWLGDTISVIVPTPPDILQSNASLTVLEVRDRDGAEAFLRNNILSPFVVEREGYIEEELAGGILFYENENYFRAGFSDFYYIDDSFILTSKDRMLIERFVSPTREARLAQTDGFNAVLEALPADNYNLIGYVNVAPLVGDLYTRFSSFAFPTSVTDRIDLDALLASLGVQGFGGTILDDRVFALDMVAVHGDPTILGALGLPEFEFPDAPAVDLEFARFMPANAALYQQVSNVGTQSRVASENSLRLLPPLINNYLVPILETTDPQAARNLRTLPLAVITGAADGAITELTTLTTDQFYDVIDGQFGVYIQFTSADRSSIEAAALFENVQPALTAQMLDGLENNFTRQQTDFIRDGDVLLFSGLPAGFDAMSGLPRASTNSIGVIDGLLVLASEVTYRAPARGESLAELPAFAYMTQFYPEQIDLLWYINPSALSQVADREGAVVFEFLESLTLVATSNENRTWIRAMITLAE